MAPGKYHRVLVVCVVLLLIQGAVVQADSEPYVNPLGDLDAYSYLDLIPVSDLWDPWDFGYLDEDDEYWPISVWGDVWHFEVSDSSLKNLRAYLGRLDSTIMTHTEELLVAQVNGPEGLWWVRAESWDEDYYELTVIEEKDAPDSDEDYDNEYYEDDYEDDYDDEGYDDEDYEAYERYDDEERETDLSEVPLPLINPLVDIEAYEYFGYGPTDLFEISYYNALGEASTHFGWGEVWFSHVPFGDGDRPLPALEEHILVLGGTIIESTESMLRASVIDAESNEWQAIAQLVPGENRYSLDVTKELLVQPGRSVTIMPQPGQETVSVITHSDGRQHRSLVVEISNGEISLDGRMVVSYGEYKRSWDQGFPIVHERTPLHIFDCIPQEQGKTIWVMTLAEETRPEKITISVKESLPLQTLRMGEQLGVLRIVGASVGEVSVEPSFEMGIHHPDFQRDVGDLSPEGDYVFYLPAGYWDVEQFSTGHAPIRARMVPVNAGEITVFHMPSITQTVLEDFPELVEVSGAFDLSRHMVKGEQAEFDFVLTPALSTGLVPTIETTEISEGGLMGSIISIEPVIMPPDIVVLLDSSGSMWGQMDQTLIAAREFIGSLEDDTFIQVVDFDTTPRVLKGTTKTEVLASLSAVRADGATCLYDSILAGLDLLESRNRPVLVVFTDGVDANWDDTGPGSVATLPQVVQAVQERDIPLYTIGFGSGHDKTVLQQLADISSGNYYPASDQDALNQVFKSINESLSNTYHLVYQRPTESDISDIPVVSIMVDTSGSMDLSPEEGDDCGYRMQRVKNILHDFILGLPPQTLMQIQSFSWGPIIEQSMTLDKASALHAVGAFWAGGGTDIIGSLQVAHRTLSATPSKNKTLVYITDAAIAVEQDQETVDQLLEAIADSDIKAIWMGVGMENEEEVFANAAAKSKGRYIVTEDHLKLASALDEVLAEVKTAVADSSTVEVRLVVKETGEENVLTRYIATLGVPYTKLAKNEQIVGPGVATYYGTGVAADPRELRAYGLSDDSDSDLVTRFIPLDADGANLAMDMKVTGATASNTIAGLRAPDGRQFISINFALRNVLEAQEVEIDAKGNNHPANWMSSVGSSGRKEFRVPQYLIPSLSSHLYLGWNNEGMYPVSQASWIVPDSLLVPGDISLTVNPEEPLEGSLVFLVDEQPISQMSLHFYDVAYGHFKIDLIGTSEHEELQLETLPPAEPARLSDVFELRVTAVHDVTEVGPVTANNSNVFRIVEMDLTSRVQALLDINPQEVFSLRVLSGDGVFFVPLHQLTRNVPFGFNETRMVAPGSFNKVRFVFEIPRALAENTSQLFVDLREDDVVLPLTGARVATPEPSGQPVAAEGIELYVNQIGRVKDLGSAEVNYVVADVTFVDAQDGFGTELFDGFHLIRDDYSGVSSEVDTSKLVTEGGLGDFTGSGEVLYRLMPGAADAQFVLGFDDPVVKDGLTRRVLIVFEIPADGEDHQWTLQSDIFKDLNRNIPLEDYTHPGLLGYKTEPGFTLDSADFEHNLSMAIAAAIREHQARQAARGQLETQDRMDLSGIDDQEVTIAPPMAVISGTLALEDIGSVEQLVQLLRSMKWLPSADFLWQARYAPEAVLTQMWGTEADMASLAEGVLVRLGCSPARSMVDLTDTGLIALADRAQVPAESLEVRHLPAVTYSYNGAERLLVLPFATDASEIPEYVSTPVKLVDTDPFPLKAGIFVSFDVVAKSAGFGGQFGDFAAVLAGDEDGEETLRHPLIEVELPLTDLSMDALDLVYVSGGGDLYTAVLETPRGRYIGEDALDTAEYEIKGATIEIAIGDDRYAHTLVLEPDQSITEVAHTIAINSPDLPSEAAKQLQQIADTLHQSTDRPDSLSVLKWYTRNIINRFVVAHTETEHDLARAMGLAIGRTRQPRVIVVTVEGDAPNKSIHSSIDLLSAANDIHNGDPLTQRAFNIGAGLIASNVEAKALGDGLGVFEIWAYLPPDATMLWIDEYNRDTALEILEVAGFKRSVRQRIWEAEDKVIVIPLEQVILDGTLRTAWLEVDPETYFAIGVIDSGEHGAMLESAVQNLLKQFTKYSVGAIVGVHSMVWGVSGFALEYAEYEEILAAAVNHSIAMANQVKKALEELAKIDPRQVKSIMEKVEKKSLSAINDPGQFVKDEFKANIRARAEKIPKDKIDELLPKLSFVDGMMDGIELFATYARP